MYAFGSGVLIGTLAGANQTPYNFGLIQECSFDDKGSVKPLFGQYQRPVAIGMGTRRATIKAKSARISGFVLGLLYYGLAPVAGQTATIIAEAGTVPTTPFQITVANSANWTLDQGVVDATTGLPLKRVASAPATGQYSVAAGVYTFAAADAARTVLISYNYTVSASGQSIVIANPLLGPTVSFAVNLYGVDPTTNLGYSFQLYNVVMSSHSFATKLEDFVMPDWEAECYVNAAGNLGKWNFPDVA